MRFALSPLYRSTVGFDSLASMLDPVADDNEATTYPPYNIERTGEDAYRISMAVAGFSEKDIAIEAHRNVLSVKGERKAADDTTGKDYFVREVAYGTFQRRFALPEGVDAAHVEAKSANGMLEVRVPAPRAATPRTIEVKAA